MNIANIKLPIAVIGIIVAQAFGIIWYVAQLDSTVSNNTESIKTEQDIRHRTLDELELRLYDDTEILELLTALEERLDELENKDAIMENEMRTIMSVHSSFNDILKELGKEGYGDKREYGNYGD